MKYLISFFFFLFFLTPIQSHAGWFSSKNPSLQGPIETRPQNPLLLQHLYLPLQRAVPLEKNKNQFSFETTFSNIFEFRNPPTGTQLNLDMELYRFALEYKRGIADRTEIGISLPFYHYSGGFLDSFIQNFHNTFGFPNGGRHLVPNGQFSYRMTDAGRAVFQTNPVDFGMGDISGFAKYQFIDEGDIRPAVAIAGAIKAPTGKSSQGLGSGFVDLAISLIFEKTFHRFHFYNQLGAIALTGHKQMSPYVETSSFLFGQAIEFNLRDNLSLIAQLQGQTSPYKNVTIEELQHINLDLTFGLNGNPSFFKKRWSYQLGFSEDPISDGLSIDFSFFFKSSYLF